MSAVSYSRVGSESAQSRGVIYIHACPNAVAPHLEWALAKVLGTEVPMEWAPQPVAPGQLRSQIIWSGKQGMGARIASALLAFHHARYEVTEDPAAAMKANALPQPRTWDYSGPQSEPMETLWSMKSACAAYLSNQLIPENLSPKMFVGSSVNRGMKSWKFFGWPMKTPRFEFCTTFRNGKRVTAEYCRGYRGHPECPGAPRRQLAW